MASVNMSCPATRNSPRATVLPSPLAAAEVAAPNQEGGEAEDNFQFALSREEVLDLFFEDLELPDMVKLSLKEAVTFKPRRAGFSTAGAPNNINVGQTMRNSFGRRIALHRPKLSQIEALRAEISALEQEDSSTSSQKARLIE